MKKLYSVTISFSIPVAANSIEDAEAITRNQIDSIISDFNENDLNVDVLWLNECPLEYVSCLPYVDYDDESNEDSKLECQYYFEKSKNILENKINEIIFSISDLDKLKPKLWNHQLQNEIENIKEISQQSCGLFKNIKEEQKKENNKQINITNNIIDLNFGR